MSVYTRSFKKTGFAATLVAGVSIFAMPAYATVILSGSDSGTGSITTTGNTSSQLIIGIAAPGSLTINASGSPTTVNATSSSSIGVAAGYFTNGDGTILVDGNGAAGSATLNSTKAIEIGLSTGSAGTGGNGTLTVQNGGLAKVLTNDSEITIGNSFSTGSVTVDGANSVLSSGARINVGSFQSAVGSLTIQNSGHVESTYTVGGFSPDGAIVIGAGDDASGTVIVQTNGTLATTGIIVGDTETGSTGSLTVQSGGTVTAGVLSNGTGAGLSIGADGGAQVTVTGAGSNITVAPITSGFSAGKEVSIGGFATGSLLVDQSATVNAAGANVHVSGGADGTLTTAAGTLSVKNGASLTADTVTVYQNGTLNGTGTVNGAVTLSGGVLAPGNSPGTLTINGPLDLTSGVLNLEIGNGVVDHLDVSGAVTVGKDVVFNLIFEFVPSFNQVFDLEDFFSAGSGLSFDPAFDLDSQLTVAGLPGGSSVVVNADRQTETVAAAAAVPEPASIAILLAGLAGLGAARRRRRPV